MVWNNKNNKAYALSVALVSKAINKHINSMINAWHALRKLKDFYDLHSKLELIYL